MAHTYHELKAKTIQELRLPLIAVTLLLFLSSVSAQAPPSPPSDCSPSGAIRYVCGLAGPEDLAAVPQTKWLIASAMSGEGGLYLIDTTQAQATGSRIFPAAGAERFDRREYGACPGPLSATQAVTHGLYLKPGRSSVHTLYAVHHGDRESIEVFEVNAKATRPAVTWIGCAVVPDPVGINSVAALPDGGFVLTNFDPRQPPPPGGGRGGGLSSKLMAGEQNGEIWEWHAKSGWAKVPGSEAAGANGIEVSRDGKWLYVAQWGKQSFLRLSRGKTPVERQEIPLGFRTDNIRWAPDGKTLLVAGQGTVAAQPAQPGGQRGRGQAAQATVVVRVNPQTMMSEEVIRQAPGPGQSAASVAVQVGDELWVGSFRGDRLTRYPGSGPK
jgi:hypothetical protein